MSLWVLRFVYCAVVGCLFCTCVDAFGLRVYSAVFALKGIVLCLRDLFYLFDMDCGCFVW